MAHTPDMTASLGKRLARWALLLSPWFLALLLGAGWFLSSWTPVYLEKLVPGLAREMGLPLHEFTIRRAGLFSADIGPVRLGPKKNGLRLNTVRLEYTPASLRRKRVNAVIIQGLHLHAQYTPQGWRIPLLDSLDLKSDSNKTTSLLPLPFDRVDLDGALLDLEINGTPLAVPFMARVEPTDKSIPFHLKLRPRDQTLDVDGVYTPGNESVSFTVDTASLRLGAWADLLPVPLKGVVDLNLEAGLAIGPAQAMLDSLQARLDMAVHKPDLTALSLPFTGDATLVADIAGTSADFTLSVADMQLAGTAAAKQNASAWSVRLEAGNQGAITLPAGGQQAVLSGLQLSTAGTVGPDGSDLTLEVRSKGITVDRKLHTGPISLDLPLAWPTPKKGAPGSLAVAGLRFGTHRIGSLSARLWQQGLGAGLKGTLRSKLLPGLSIDLKGQYAAETETGTLNFKSLYTLRKGTDLSQWVPDLAGYTVSGDMDLDGGLHFGPDGLQSNAALYLTDGTLHHAESNLSVTGILLIFESPDLTELRSAPAQLFSFNELRAGTITVTNGRASFQLERGGVILAESGSFDWAGGHVSTQAFRVVPGKNEYDVVLFCNELKLSEILGQLGLAEAHGRAAMSGELPVTWKNGKISFNGGFLHSTPGEGGVIQVDAMETLLDAIPKGTPQRGQLELAQEAVKDFEYKWVRLKADTVGDDLFVRLSLDGKPRSTLPFVYRKEFGGFIKVEGDMQGSNFQGLRLDVNFSLPLDRILLYKELIKMIE